MNSTQNNRLSISESTTLAMVGALLACGSALAQEPCPESTLVCEPGTHKSCIIPTERPIYFAEEFCVLDSNPAKRHGEYRQYYYGVTTQIKEQLRYVNGKPNGHSVEYHMNGQIQQIGEVKNDYRVGTWESFTDTGVRISQVMYDDRSRPIGTWTRWRKDGSLENIQVYENHKLLYAQAFTSQGVLERETFDTPEHPNGELRVFDETGTVVVRSGYFRVGGIEQDPIPRQDLMSARKVPTTTPSSTPSIAPSDEPKPGPATATPPAATETLANQDKIQKDLTQARCQHIKFMTVGEELSQLIRTDPFAPEMGDFTPSQLVEWLIEPNQSEIRGQVKQLTKIDRINLKLLAQKIRQKYFDQTRVWIPTQDKERHIRFGFVDGFTAENEIKSFSRITGNGMELPWPAILNLSLKTWGQLDGNALDQALSQLKCQIGEFPQASASSPSPKILGIDAMGFLNPSVRESFRQSECQK